jgi:predicted acyltransferase
LRRRATFAQFLFKAIKRALILIILGMVVDSAVQHELMIGLGVLQLIGIAYLIGSLFAKTPPTWRFIVAAGLLATYAIFLHSTGDYTPEGNGAKWINDYLTPFGLRGLLSALPTGAAVLLGSALGELWRSRLPRGSLLALVVGGLLAVIGLVWGIYTPHLKPIWTPSYICLTIGVGMVVLAGFQLISLCPLRRTLYPIRVAGQSPIFAYVAPILVKVMILQEWKWPGSDLTLEASLIQILAERFGEVTGPWFYTGIYVLFWWVIFLYLDWKNIVIKV